MNQYSLPQFLVCIGLTGLLASASAQQLTAKPSIFKEKVPVNRQAQENAALDRASREGVGARIKDIARFRGIRSNQLSAIGLVFGLDGTGDSKKISATTSMLSNYLKRENMPVDPANLEARNAALVMVTAELPPFAVNGQSIDVTVTSMGDAKSLRNGTLLMTPLHAAGNSGVVYATASGSVSVGGYTASAGGNSQAVGFVTVGRIPGGGVVENEAPTTTVYDGKMFLELDEPDITTAHRMEQKIDATFPEYHAIAINGGTIQLDLPPNMNAITAMARLEDLTVHADTPALVVINEKTGTIVMGGEVRLAACSIATGSLSVKVEEQVNIIPPDINAPGGAVKSQTLNTGEDKAQIALLKPNTTIGDLSRVFQELKLKPSDIINILQLLRQQGALKARVVMQ